MTVTVNIQYLKCGGCSSTIVNKLSKINNISEFEFNPADESVSFEYQTKG